MARAAFQETGGRRGAAGVDAEPHQRAVHEDVLPAEAEEAHEQVVVLVAAERLVEPSPPRRRGRLAPPPPPAGPRPAASRSPKGAPSGRPPRTRRSCVWDGSPPAC